jgi:putative phosphoesterase
VRIGILSDTHDQFDRTRRAVKLLRAAGAEALFHCGDLTSPEIIEICAGQMVHYVYGNNDFDTEDLARAMKAVDAVNLQWEGTIELHGCRIAMTHGDRSTSWRRLIAEEPNYLLSGHTHEASDQRHGPVRFINPGALHRARRHSVALLDLASDELTILNVS